MPNKINTADRYAPADFFVRHIWILEIMLELHENLKKGKLKLSGNPLRIGEPERCFGAQTNIWGEQPGSNEPAQLLNYLKAKEIQNISICLDDIQHLFQLMELTVGATEYTNRLIGKYIIVEIHNIETCFNNLARVSIDFKAVNGSLRKKLKELDKLYSFKDIRNKIAAHRHDDKAGNINVGMGRQIELWRKITYNALIEYYKVIAEHIMMLRPIAKIEFSSYIAINNKEIPGIAAGDDPDYPSFWG